MEEKTKKMGGIPKGQGLQMNTATNEMYQT
jgi:hypothetical protein